jgi:hypothetical protein
MNKANKFSIQLICLHNPDYVENVDGSWLFETQKEYNIDGFKDGI